MDNKEKIKKEIKRIIDAEKAAGRFSVLEDKHVDLITQIVMSEIMVENVNNETFRSNEQEVGEKKTAELIFIAAPTGAGKDTLVRRVTHNNRDKKYVVLNMDIFRHYYTQFREHLKETYPGGLKDREFAIQTNAFSYEIYYTMQRVLLENFPGTNIIITGTIHEIDWVEETFRVFKQNPYTNYINKLFALAVPKKVCEISAIERYLGSIARYETGTARYVSLDYYTKTINNFTNNLGYFEECLNRNDLNEKDRILDVIEVYRRSLYQGDFEEDTLLYTSNKSAKLDDLKSKNGIGTTTAKQIVEQIINSEVETGFLTIAAILDKIASFKDYLENQDLYVELLENIKKIYREEVDINNRSKKNIEELENIIPGKYPGSDD